MNGGIGCEKLQLHFARMDFLASNHVLTSIIARYACWVAKVCSC